MTIVRAIQHIGQECPHLRALKEGIGKFKVLVHSLGILEAHTWLRKVLRIRRIGRVSRAINDVGIGRRILLDHWGVVYLFEPFGLAHIVKLHAINLSYQA